VHADAVDQGVHRALRVANHVEDPPTGWPGDPRRLLRENVAAGGFSCAGSAGQRSVVWKVWSSLIGFSVRPRRARRVA